MKKDSLSSCDPDEPFARLRGEYESIVRAADLLPLPPEHRWLIEHLHSLGEGFMKMLTPENFIEQNSQFKTFAPVFSQWLAVLEPGKAREQIEERLDSWFARIEELSRNFVPELPAWASDLDPAGDGTAIDSLETLAVLLYALEESEVQVEDYEFDHELDQRIDALQDAIVAWIETRENPDIEAGTVDPDRILNRHLSKRWQAIERYAREWTRRATRPAEIVEIDSLEDAISTIHSTRKILLALAGGPAGSIFHSIDQTLAQALRAAAYWVDRLDRNRLRDLVRPGRWEPTAETVRAFPLHGEPEIQEIANLLTELRDRAGSPTSKEEEQRTEQIDRIRRLSAIVDTFERRTGRGKLDPLCRIRP